MGRLCMGIWAMALGKAEVELELLVLRSRPSPCFMASSAFCTPATSFHSCCRSAGHMAAGDGGRRRRRRRGRDFKLPHTV